jgi:hypothetical protein
VDAGFFVGLRLWSRMYTDPFQEIRMTYIWPVLIGCVAFYGVRFIASTLDGALSRWQALMAAVTGLMAVVVSLAIARQWSGSVAAWLSFTVGLGFATLVLLLNAAVTVLLAGRPAHEE